MTDKNMTKESRRKLLKSVAAGGGAIIAGKTLPDTWTKPAVDSVVLPAHAVTSNGPYSGSSFVALLGSDSDSLLAQAVESVVPQAHAGPAPVRELIWCVEPNADQSAADVYFLLTYSVGGYICSAQLWEKTNVPAWTTTDLGDFKEGCNNTVVGGEWLNNLGLVNDAHASGVASVTLNALTEFSKFTFTEGGGQPETRTLKNGVCSGKTVNCRRDKCNGFVVPES